MASYKKIHGMTLIEVIIVVAILGILGSITVSSYSRHVLKQRRVDAHHLLHANAQRLQRCLTLIGAYDGGCALQNTSSEGHYTLNATLTAQTWQITAVPAAGSPQLNDGECISFTMRHTGHKTASGSAADHCW